MAYTKQQEEMYVARSSIRTMRVLAVGLGTEGLGEKASLSRNVAGLRVMLMSVEPLALLSTVPSTLPLMLAFARFVAMVGEIERPYEGSPIPPQCKSVICLFVRQQYGRRLKYQADVANRFRERT